MSRGDELAFPAEGTLERGLTIREHFAAMAMQGLCANANHSGRSFAFMAEDAVAHADALLAALQRPQRDTVTGTTGDNV